MISSRCLPALALAAGALWLADPLAAFTLTGDTLPFANRTVRVFDNFADAEAHTNTTEVPAFPGYTDVEVAIWKAIAEWGSALHGDGTGDPSQPGDLGSGGANFDFVWGGAASGVGAVGDGVVSAIPGSAGGLLVVTEIGPGGGWRMRFYESWTWSDDPSVTAPAGTVDIQGIATREFGRLLGLGNSGVAGATMAPVGDPVAVRSLHPDDSNGVQAIYGPAAASKPSIAGATIAGGVLTLVGANFDPTSNTVLLPPSAVGASGPFELPGVPSFQGGTRIDLPLLLTAGPGDVHVRVPGAGSGGASLSNGWPVDTGNPPPVCGAEPYGLAFGGANVASLTATGAFVPGGAATLQLAGFDPASPLAFVGVSGGLGTLPLFGGTLLLDPVGMLVLPPVPLAGGAGSRAVTLPAGGGFTVFLQAAAPDATQPEGIALTHGLRIATCP